MSALDISPKHIAVVVAYTAYAQKSETLLEGFATNYFHYSNVHNENKDDLADIAKFKELGYWNFTSQSRESAFLIICEVLARTNGQGCFKDELGDSPYDCSLIMGEIIKNKDTWIKEGKQTSFLQIYKLMMSLKYNSDESPNFKNSFANKFLSYCMENLLSKTPEFQQPEWMI